MTSWSHAPLLARTDIGELIPFLIFLFVIIGRFVKMLAERGRSGDESLGSDAPRPADGSDPGASIRQFLEDLRRQAGGEPPAATMAKPPPQVAQSRSERHLPPLVASSAAPRSRSFLSAKPKAVQSAVQAVAVPVASVAAPKVPAAPPPSVAARRPPSPWTAALRRGTNGLREAVVLREVLDPPVALRGSRSPGFNKG